jgi:F0F1-type ATP synthase assembly protein I
MQPTVNALNFTQITQPDQVRGDENLLIVAYLVGDILGIMIRYFRDISPLGITPIDFYILIFSHILGIMTNVD